jgi:hypothetical protein
MKLTDKTTVTTLREMIGQKVRSRTSRALIEITDIELTKDETWFVGFEGSKKRRIKMEHITHMYKVDEDDEIEESKKPFKNPIRVAEEKRLKKSRPAPNIFPDNSPKFELGDMM